MIHQSYEYVAERWNQYWNFENHDRPILTITAPRDRQRPADFKTPDDIAQRWLDVDYVIKNSRLTMENTYYAGEAFPTLNPNLGPDITGAICGGCNIEFGEDTSWAVPYADDWAAFPPIRFDENNIWWKRIAALTEAAAKDAHSDYLVGYTDLHSGTDGLVSIRGPQRMCCDLIDNPEEILKRLDEMFAAHKMIFKKLQEIILPYHTYYTNWTSVLHPTDDWYPVSSDFSCLVSSADYDTFVAPSIESEIGMYRHSMYHLDGPGALRHLDRILQMKDLGAVQWVSGAGQPTARAWLDILRKIQKAGKGIQVNCTLEDLKPVCEALEPEGVNFVIYAKSEDDAKTAVKMVDELYSDKRKH